VAFAALPINFGRFARGYRGNGSPLSGLERQDLAACVPAIHPNSQQERPMSVLAIPSILSAAISGLSHHAHKKGGQGVDNSALGSISSTGTSNTETSSASSASGSQSLFGSIMITAARAALQKS
jgi:hypothetical protein